MKRRQEITGRRFAASLLALVLLSTSTAVAEEVSELSRGQTVYVPVYSRVWYGNLVRCFQNNVPIGITQRRRFCSAKCGRLARD
jgi:hypothetical protein